MIRIKVFKTNSNSSCNPNHANEELEPMENFIAQIGYDRIKNIVVSPGTDIYSYYSIFYEDGLPYTPRTETAEPKKKGIFG